MVSEGGSFLPWHPSFFCSPYREMDPPVGSGSFQNHYPLVDLQSVIVALDILHNGMDQNLLWMVTCNTKTSRMS